MPPITVGAAGLAAFTSLQSTNALRSGMPVAAYPAELGPRTVLLDMAEALTLEAPEGLWDEPPDGVNAPDA